MNQDLAKLKQHPAVFRMYADRVRLQKDGKEFRCSCPFHAGDNTPSCRIFWNDGTLIYKCFGCDSKGSIIDFVSRFDKINIPQAIRKIEEYVGKSWQESASKVDNIFKPAVEEEKEIKTYSLDQYRKLEQALEQNTFAQNWLLQERGITMETARQLHFGYKQSILSRSDEIQDILDKGWISMPRIEGNIVTGIHYRSIIRKAFSRQSGMQTSLFNTEAIDPLEPVWVTEGEMDTACLVQAGFRAVSIPNATTKITPAMKDQIMQADCIILAGDCDGAAGSRKMEKLWAELQERTYLLKWPDGMKDANQTFLEHCKKNIDKFRALVEELTATARSKPMQGVYSVQHSLATTQHSRLIDHPDRLHLPWKTVQDMAIILPGTITTIYSSESGQGKSTFAIQATLFAARESGKVALNYQAEMSPLQIDTIFTSHLLKKDRLQLQNEDYQKAAQILGPDFKYYIGRDTSLTNIGEVLDLIEAAIKRFGAEIVILDNLHFLARNEIDSVKATANAMQRITNLTAKYGLYFFVVHQARKADQNHKRKVTHVSDLDGSKAVQNDSTTIFSIHREEVKHGKDETDSDSHEYSPVTEIRLQKARDKGEGTSFTRVMFLGNICTFADMSGVSPAQEESETTEGEGLF